MWTLFKYEWKSGIKSFAIWTLLIGGMGLVCLLIYQSIEGDMAKMADSFSSMGAFSDAFGMSTLSIATFTGYFATEIGTIHGLGSGMFAASLATTILSKEEDGHTADFSYVLPVSRQNIYVTKLLYVFASLLLFTIVCAGCYLGAYLALEEEIPAKGMIVFLSSQLLMNLVIAGICIIISAMSKKNKLGIGMGVALLLYFYDLIIRMVPKFEEYKFFSPYSFCNAAEIFAKENYYHKGAIVGVSALIISIVVAGYIMRRKDFS